MPGSQYQDEQGRPAEWETLTFAGSVESARAAAITKMEAVFAAMESGQPQDTFFVALTHGTRVHHAGQEAP